MVDITHSYNMNSSTPGTILKSKDKIRQQVKSSAPMKSTITSKKHGGVTEETEKLFSVRMKDQHRVPLSLMLTQDKA